MASKWNIADELRTAAFNYACSCPGNEYAAKTSLASSATSSTKVTSDSSWTVNVSPGSRQPDNRVRHEPKVARAERGADGQKS